MIADIHVTEKRFGSKLLYSNLKFSVQAGEKIGVVGRNGVGKSTLLGIMAKTDLDFQGEIIYKRGLVTASTRQEHHGFEELSVVDYILGDLPEYTGLKKIMDTYPETMGEDMKKITEYSEALERFGTLGYYIIEDLILQDLAAFQISEEKARRPLGNLSGGQKRLAEVVKVMHSHADLALIDEPTNHMDYIAKEQFINWVKEANQAMLIITHDRDVLGCVDKIIEIKDNKAHSYPGNYRSYLRQNAVSTTTGLHDHEMVLRQIINLKEKVIQFRRFKERARDPNTIKQFKRRENEASAELAKLQAIEKPTFWIDKESQDSLNYKVSESYDKYKTKNIKLQGISDDVAKSSKLLVSTINLALGYAEPLFENLNFQLHEGEKLELRGRNGAGKSTLIKAILAKHADKQPETLQKGEIIVSNQVRVGLYEQEVSAEYFTLTLKEAIERIYLDKGLSIGEQKTRQLMDSYLFEYSSDANIRVANLSGGQKARVQLISMLANDPQLLILDEPTNHLDLPSIEELEGALEKYGGAVIYVSHDDYFRQNIPAEVLNIGK